MGAKVYCVCNQKGGVGKTVTSVNLGIGLARLGRKVLLVDKTARVHLLPAWATSRQARLDRKSVV